MLWDAVVDLSSEAFEAARAGVANNSDHLDSAKSHWYSPKGPAELFLEIQPETPFYLDLDPNFVSGECLFRS